MQSTTYTIWSKLVNDMSFAPGKMHPVLFEPRLLQHLTVAFPIPFDKSDSGYYECEWRVSKSNRPSEKRWFAGRHASATLLLGPKGSTSDETTWPLQMPDGINDRLLLVRDVAPLLQQEPFFGVAPAWLVLQITNTFTNAFQREFRAAAGLKVSSWGAEYRTPISDRAPRAVSQAKTSECYSYVVTPTSFDDPSMAL